MPVTFSPSLTPVVLPDVAAAGIWQQSQTVLPVLPAQAGLGSVVDLNCCQGQIVIGQNFDQDILGDIRTGFQGFVESGQVWALLIGVVLGYLLKSITSSH